MKKTMSRVLSLALAIAMIFTLPMTASADVGGTVWAPSAPPSTPSVPSMPPVVQKDKEIDVTFNGGDELEGELDVPAEALNADGELEIQVEEGAILPPEVVPETATVDAYYTQLGWVLEDDYLAGRYDKLVDLTTYVPVDEDTFYAVYLDTWKPYSDMKQDRSDWFYKFVRDLSIAGVVNGSDDGRYLPLKDLSYGEALKLIMLATGYDVQAPTDDIHWASGYYTKALEDGLVEEEGIDLYSSITRREVAEITVKALDLPDPTIESPFADTDLDVAIAMFEAGLMIGTDLEDGSKVFKPETNISRAEIATVIWRIYHLYEAKTAA